MEVADRADRVGVALNVLAVIVAVIGVGVAIWIWFHGQAQACYGTNFQGGSICQPVGDGNRVAAVIEIASALITGVVIGWFGYVLRMLVSIRRAHGQGGPTGPGYVAVPPQPLPTYPPVPPFPGGAAG